MRNKLALWLATALLTAGPVAGGDTETILRITGSIDQPAATFDLESLRAMPQTTLVTSTVVTDGTHRFTGVLMRDLLDSVGASGDIVVATALNDYIVDLPMSDFHDYDVILAHAMDGAPLERDDKGPLWIVYPRDDHAELQDIRYDYRWVWHLSGLEVR
ncbi:molybdopterin-dependent oxidoreductase [Oceaniglobus trochenteri]|uniref:molybdopterin-dependent oxidoreductase n=1 Tax=Oceaniglobus trochenteri TaxID=2763260 RepID=UPI001CFFF0B8|nr:molybdopterin-dependent oxidoreductase [Oceaniglobus trochenteri]